MMVVWRRFWTVVWRRMVGDVVHGRVERTFISKQFPRPGWGSRHIRIQDRYQRSHEKPTAVAAVAETLKPSPSEPRFFEGNEMWTVWIVWQRLWGDPNFTSPTWHSLPFNRLYFSISIFWGCRSTGCIHYTRLNLLHITLIDGFILT